MRVLADIRAQGGDILERFEAWTWMADGNVPPNCIISTCLRHQDCSTINDD